MTRFHPAHRTERIAWLFAAVGLAVALVALPSCGGGGNGGSSGGMIPSGPVVQPTISSIQANIFTPKCALSGCHAGPTPQPLSGPGPSPGLDLTHGQATANLINVGSRLDPNFLRVAPNNIVDSYLYMKVVGDPRINIAVSGICTQTTATACNADADCPAGETCDKSGARMPRNAPALSAEETQAIADWIFSGSPGQPGY